MTASQFTDAILSHCAHLKPLPTNIEPKLVTQTGIRAVLFDVYGTLLISASGDIGANSGDHRLQAIEQTVGLFKLSLNCSATAAIEAFETEIVRSHTASQATGIEYPEVDIVEIWQVVLPRIVAQDSSRVELRRFALEYEVRVNPVWPMPEVEPTLSDLVVRELVLGIVSNAQFFTPLLFPAFWGKTLEEFGFLPELSYFSYQHRQAKPGRYLYQLAQKQLELLGIRPSEVLYVGNDMLNDVAASASVGFRTALYVGDRRSLRLREDDQRVQGIVPDIIITELGQLARSIAGEG